MTEPGAGYGGYYRLSEIVAKKIFPAKQVTFFIRDGAIFVDDRQVQGIRIVDDVAIITGWHFTSWERATQIRSMERIEPSLEDPFVYLSEPGVMQNWSDEAIRKELGAGSSDTIVKLSIIVPISVVWLRGSRRVVHFAIAQAVTDSEIRDLRVQRRKAA